MRTNTALFLIMFLVFSGINSDESKRKDTLNQSNAKKNSKMKIVHEKRKIEKNIQILKKQRLKLLLSKPFNILDEIPEELLTNHQYKFLKENEELQKKMDQLTEKQKKIFE